MSLDCPEDAVFNKIIINGITGPNCEPRSSLKSALYDARELKESVTDL